MFDSFYGFRIKNKMNIIQKEISKHTLSLDVRIVAFPIKVIKFKSSLTSACKHFYNVNTVCTCLKIL